MKFEQQACYQVSAQDNVATALGDIPAGSVSVTGDIGPQGKKHRGLARDTLWTQNRFAGYKARRVYH